MLLTLWDDEISRVEDGKTFRIVGGQSGLFQGRLQVSLGRSGKLEPSDQAIGEIKTEKEIAKEKVERIEVLPEKEEISEKKLKDEDFEKFTVKQLTNYASKNKIPVPIKARKSDLIKIIEKEIVKKKYTEAKKISAITRKETGIRI